MRVEDPEVFAETHVEVKRWFDEGLVDGLRVDHPDGLRDPKRYLDDLAALTGGAYVLVEKILEPGEHLPADWATDGTTGYDALALIDRVLTDPAGEAPLTALEDRLRGTTVDWEQMVHDNKRAVADGILHSEVLRITREVERALDVDGRRAPTRTPSPTRSASCSPASPSTAPTCPRAATTSTRPSPGRGSSAPTSRRRTTSSSRCCTTSGASRPGASSRPRAWSWPRVSRTARSTAGRG